MSPINIPRAPFKRRRALALLASAVLVVCAPVSFAQKNVAAAASPVNVVATFSVLGDMVREVGGEHVQVTTIVGPNGDAHTFEPSPRDAKALAKADVLVLNGLDFEGWLPRLKDASGFKGRQVLASQGVSVRHLGPGEFFMRDGQDAHTHAQQAKPDSDHGHDHGHDHAQKAGAGDDRHEHAIGDVDPHAWQDLANGVLYARNIAEGLALVDPAHASYYRRRAELYVAQMEKLDAEIKNALKDIPAERRTVITSHDAFGYFGRAYGIRFVSVAGFSSDAEPTARDVAAIIDMARKRHVAGIFIENVSNPALVKQIAKETKAKLGGTLYSDALAPEGQPAANYLGMFSWNAGQLINALKPAQK